MNPQHPRRLGLFALVLATLAVLACGGDESDPMDQGPIDDDTQPPAPDVVGYTIYAVDLNNRLLLFGSLSSANVSKVTGISGLPILNRIVGLDFHPSNGKLYGVGNDSRVYTIDPETAVATAVSAEQFSPIISSFFDIHFGMGFDPVSERIVLMSAESGLNWSIDPDDGTAIRGQDVHYAPGEPVTGRPAIMGLAYVPPGSSFLAAPPVRAAMASLAAQDRCDDIDIPFTGVDHEQAFWILTCRPEEAAFIILESLQGIDVVFGCGEVKFDPEGNLFGSFLDGVQQFLATIDPATGEVKDQRQIDHSSPIQGIAFDPDEPFRAPSQNTVAAAGDVQAWAASGDLQSCTGAKSD